MSRLQPKEFQAVALEKLRDFLERCARRGGESVAGCFAAAGGHGSYRPMAALEGVPSVCLRLPTGGGKTLVAAMAVGVAARSYRDTDTPMVLWLTPSDAIATQTLHALCNPDHPYRAALQADFANVAVYALSDFDQITPQVAATGCTVVVGTMQSLRRGSQDVLRAYATNENLEGFFTAEEVRAAMRGGAAHGTAAAPEARLSFANVLRKRRPIVIVDEAHNFATQLSAEVQTRLQPSAVVEFTATPDRESNVLYRATAAELKEAELIKLPVVLQVHATPWQDALGCAIAERKRLEMLAAEEGQYLRPLLLIQAEPQGRESDWQAVRRFLIESEGIAEAEVAVQTAGKKELPAPEVLMSPRSAVRYIVSQQALREGWDCPFAYVFCSTANVGNAKDVEQWLGRVLRMPYASRRRHDDLNKAYAHVASQRFQETALRLTDALVLSGFDRNEAEGAVETPLGALIADNFRQIRQRLETRPDVSALPVEQRARVRVDEVDAGVFELRASGPLPEAFLEEVVRCAAPAAAQEAREELARYRREWQPAPAELGTLFRVPALVVEEDGQTVLFHADDLDLLRDLNLLDYPVELSDFRAEALSRRFSLDVEDARVRVEVLDAGDVLLPVQEVSPERLAGWLDRKLRRMEVSPRAMTAWILQSLRGVWAQEGAAALLWAGKFQLLERFQQRLAFALEGEAAKGYQTALSLARVAMDDEFGFTFGRQYPAHWWYLGPYAFQKHYYPRPGELQAGDRNSEFQCAVELDSLPEVRFWVRNLAAPGEGRERSSFWLQAPGGRFYPDFVAQLEDGATLVVEYKGRKDEDDVWKERVGRIWAERSGGRAVFVMVREPGVAGRSMAEQMAEAIRAARHRSLPMS